MQIMQQPEAALFSAPVSDADAPGYSSVVGRPMDLGTIKGRLQRKKYLHPAEVYADIRQVLRCAVLHFWYAKQHSWYAEQCSHLSTKQSLARRIVAILSSCKLTYTTSHCDACPATEQVMHPRRQDDAGDHGL